MKNLSKLASPLLSIALGVLLLVFKGGIISIALTVLGVLFIVMGVMDLVNKQNQTGLIRFIIGAVIIALGWLLVSVALYIFAVLLVLSGAYGIFTLTKNNKKLSIAYIQPILLLIAGACLFFNQGTTVDWVFIVVGAVLLAQGVLALYNGLKK